MGRFNHLPQSDRFWNSKEIDTVSQHIQSKIFVVNTKLRKGSKREILSRNTFNSL